MYERSSIRRTVAALALGAMTAALPAPCAHALAPTDAAGTIDGRTVAVEEADRAAAGIVAQTARSIDAVFRHAARALCTARIHDMLAAGEGLSPVIWRARIWQATRPASDEVAAFARGQGAGASADLAGLGHRMHVEAYRRALARSAERILANDLFITLAPTNDPWARMTRAPDPVATCVGHDIKSEDVERYAAYPLYERRAEMVSRLCAQFEVDTDKPLVMEQVAAAEGLTVEELLSKVEGDLGEIPAKDVEREAMNRYGRVDEMTTFKARLTLDARRRDDRRRAWLERVRREVRSQCTLVMPDAPRTYVLADRVRNAAGDALGLYYFGDFTCTHCTAGWQMLREAAAARGDRVRAEFRHHFPEGDLAAFNDALEAECAGRQGRFWDYGDWRMLAGGARGAGGAGMFSDVAEALSLDARAMADCMSDPATAVAVLEDTAEALRLGFREAVPSWVIGTRPRRGFQPQDVIHRDIEEQLAAAEAAGGREAGVRGDEPSERTRAGADANAGSGTARAAARE